MLKTLLIKLKEESMVSIAGEQWIDDCFAQLSL